MILEIENIRNPRIYIDDFFFKSIKNIEIMKYLISLEEIRKFIDR